MSLWQGRFGKELNSQLYSFNTSLPFDRRLYREDIETSIAHVTMLRDAGVIPAGECEEMIAGLTAIRSDIESGRLAFDDACEDIHTFIENELTKRIGDPGRKVHTACSRNDLVATDLRLYLRGEIDQMGELLKRLMGVLCEIAGRNLGTVMPGYTHLQRAQPVTLANHLMAYCAMFQRDYGRLTDCRRRMNECPLGSGALAGTVYAIDRHITSRMLAFDSPTANSLDGVSDRDFCVELANACALIMVHLSRFCEEIILWCSHEFQFIELDDGFATGSSLMPQKKNPDAAELIRGKTGRVFGDVMTLLTMLKGLPLAYNKDMQEDKEAVFDAVDTTKACLAVFMPMLETMTVRKENMRLAAAKGFINATDCADYLAKKGVPFREAHRITGEIVAYCIKENQTLEELPLDVYQGYSALFDADVYHAVSLETSYSERKSYGGPSAESVKRQVRDLTRDGVAG